MEMKLVGNAQNTQPRTSSEVENWRSLIMNGTLILHGLGEGHLRRILLTMEEGSFTQTGAIGEKSLQDTIIEATGVTQRLRVEKTVTIQNKSPEQLYNFWHNFENLPTFMHHLKSVNTITPIRSHWIAKIPLGNTIEWDAQIVTDLKDTLISWVSVEGAEIDNSGFVRFKAAPEGRGTEVKVVLEYNPPGGALSATIAKLFGEEPEQQLSSDLRRFKMLMETGEIATIEGQSCGRQS